MAPEVLDSAFDVEVSGTPDAPPQPPVSPDAPPPEPSRSEPTDPPDNDPDSPSPSPDAVAGADGSGEGDPDAAASEAGRKLAGKKKSLQERLAQETWEKHEARRQAAELKARLEEFERQKTAPAEPKTADQAAGTDPADPRPKLDQFETWEAYEDAREAWDERRIERKIRAMREGDERAQADRAMQARFSELENKGTAAHADFVPVLSQFAESGQRFNPYITDVVDQHELGHEIAYALASEPETFRRIQFARSLAHASVEMGKLIARLEAAPTGSAPQTVTTTNAKPPISPVGSSPVVAEQDPSTVADIDEYITRMNAKEKIPPPRRR